MVKPSLRSRYIVLKWLNNHIPPYKKGPNVTRMCISLSASDQVQYNVDDTTVCTCFEYQLDFDLHCFN